MSSQHLKKKKEIKQYMYTHNNASLPPHEKEKMRKQSHLFLHCGLMCFGWSCRFRGKLMEYNFDNAYA